MQLTWFSPCPKNKEVRRKKTWVAVAKAYKISAGSSSRDLRLTARSALNHAMTPEQRSGFYLNPASIFLLLLLLAAPALVRAESTADVLTVNGG